MTESSRLEETLSALRLVLEQLANANKPPEEDPRRRFYKMFNREADEYDKDFHRKYHDDLNTILIFAGLFSAVASAFIVDIQQELRPDYTEMSFTVLTMLLNTTSGIPNHLKTPVQSGPNPSAVQVQSILFVSLASALFAAFLAMLGKQSLNLYVEGSLIDRSRHREHRMRGMITWRFRIIMECLPFIMQLSLLLLGYALAQYLWGLSRTVSAVIAAFTAFGLLFYLLIVFAATFWKTCPFQTPASIALRYFTSSTRKYQFFRLQKIRNPLSAVVQFRNSNQSFATVTLARSIDEELASLPRTPSGTSTPGTVRVDVRGEATTQASDTNCISTMFHFAGSSDAIVALTGFILEVNWTSNVRRVPLLEVYDCLYKSFEFLKDGRVLVRPGMRAQTYGSAIALLYLRVQRLCACAMDDTRIIASNIRPLLGYHSGDHELESTLQVLDAVFNKNEEEIRWQEFVFSDTHYCWLSHILRCRAWATLRTQTTLTKEVLGFVRYSLSKGPLPQPRVIADCLLIVNMMIGKLPPLDEKFLLKDKSEEIEEILRRIYRDLELAFEPRSSVSRRKSATEALGLMAHLKLGKLYTKSYHLFLTIMADVDSDHGLWRPAELSLIGAFQWGALGPHVEDPASLMRFLEHCLSDQESGIVVDLPMERVMLALASTPSEDISKGIAGVDFTQPLFFNGICRALRNGAPHLLRRATVAFLPHLDAQFFYTDKTFSKNQVEEFISGWSSSAEELLKKGCCKLVSRALFATLTGFLDSPFWQVNMPREWWPWGVLVLPGVIGGRLPVSFYRCAKNPTVIQYLGQVDARGPKVLAHWAAILWAMYPDLSEDVRTQLEEATKRMVDCLSDRSLPKYLKLVDGQRQQVQDKLKPDSQSLGEAAAELRERLELLQTARGALIGIQKIPI